MSTAPLPAAYLGAGTLGLRGAWRIIPLIPRNIVLAALYAYRGTISHVYGDVCRYYPSCSAYAVGAVQQYGVFGGMPRALWRIARCQPWAAGGVDDVHPNHNFRYDLTPHGFVVPCRKD